MFTYYFAWIIGITKPPKTEVDVLDSWRTFKTFYNGDPILLKDYDINFNTWNIDLGFTWHFAPGSEMTFLWQNAINSFNSQLEDNYFDNIHSLLNNVQKNTLSLKIKYYLDYNKLKNANSK